jgi:hypothetical protein
MTYDIEDPNSITDRGACVQALLKLITTLEIMPGTEPVFIKYSSRFNGQEIKGIILEYIEGSSNTIALTTYPNVLGSKPLDVAFALLINDQSLPAEQRIIFGRTVKDIDEAIQLIKAIAAQENITTFPASKLSTLSVN